MPKWLSTLLIIIGIILCFTGNLFENLNEMSTDVQNKQSIETKQNSVVKQSTQNNRHELDGSKNGRTFHVGTDIPAGTYEIQAGRNSAYVSVYGGKAENYAVIAHISTDTNNVQDRELTVGDTVTLPDGGDISINGNASIVFVAK